MGGSADRKSNIEYRKAMEERFLAFAGKLILLTEEMRKTFVGRTIMGQLIRSGMSIGANFEEATAAESKADFIHKLQISLKECRETCYWLRLISQSQVIRSSNLSFLVNEALQIRAILTKSVMTAKQKSSLPA